MNQINTLNPSLSLSVNRISQQSAPKGEAKIAEGPAAFFNLLNAKTEEAGVKTPQESALPKDLQQQIEELLGTLEDMPMEELTAEQQEIMYSLIQLLHNQSSGQTEASLPAGTNSKKNLVSEIPLTEKQLVEASIEARLAELVKKLSKLTAASTADTNKFANHAEFLGVDGKNNSLDLEKVESILNKLTEVAGTLEASKKIAVLPAGQSEQVQSQMKVLAAEMEKLAKAAGETASVDESKAENPKGQLASVVTAIRSDGGEQQEPSQQEENKSSLTAAPASTDSNKTAQASPIAQAPSRPEQSAPPIPVVRMTNMTEELGEVFKNSLRMSTNGESTQIKVNISPESLGHLDIRLTETGGRIAAQIFTSSMAAKDVLDLQINQLRNTLLQQGINIDKIEVTQQNSQQSLNQQNANPEQRFTQQQRQSSAGNNKNGYQQMEEQTEVERGQLNSGMMKVDYTV